LSLPICQGRACHNIVMKRRTLLCLRVTIQSADRLGAKLIFHHGYRNETSGSVSNSLQQWPQQWSQRHIRDIYFTQFKNEGCQTLFYVCCISVFLYFTCRCALQVTILGIFLVFPSDCMLCVCNKFTRNTQHCALQSSLINIRLHMFQILEVKVNLSLALIKHWAMNTRIIEV